MISGGDDFCITIFIFTNKRFIIIVFVKYFLHLENL